MISRLAAAVGIREGAVVHSVRAKRASAGSGRLFELGPPTPIGFGLRSNGRGYCTDAARAGAYEQLPQMLSWLRLPLSDAPTGAGVDVRPPH